jgi:integrase
MDAQGFDVLTWRKCLTDDVDPDLFTDAAYTDETGRRHQSGGSRAPAALDRDPTTGRARLSYRRAAEIFSTAAPGRTLHQLRHSAITHLAEAGVPLPLLMAKSRHASLRTVQRYARPSVDAVAALTAAHDPAARRR